MSESVTPKGVSDVLSEAEREHWESLFNDLALDRLAHSTQDYYSTHGQYVPPLARLLLIERIEKRALASYCAEAERRARLYKQNADEALELIERYDERAEKAEARCAELEAALAQAIQVIEWCGQNDKTPTYGYRGKSAERRDGTTAGPGRAFNTPREFAAYWHDVLRATLISTVDRCTCSTWMNDKFFDRGCPLHRAFVDGPGAPTVETEPES